MPSSYRRVLVVDNDPDVLDAVGFNLENAGYAVFTASSVDEANQYLQGEIIHAAVIDVRLRDERLTDDTSGFDLARQIPSHVPLVIFTAYENIQTVRTALGEVKARAILSKRSPRASAELRSLLQQVFEEDVRVNFALQIESQPELSVIAQRIDVPRTDRLSKLQPNDDDLRQILQSLFHDAEAIIVTSLLPSAQAQSISSAGSVVVMVRPKLAHGWGASKVVKLGGRAEIEEEARRYEAFKDYPNGMRLPRLDSVACARQIGGLTYSLLGGSEDAGRIELFSQFFEEHDAKEIIKVLRRFFRETFGMLYMDIRRETRDFAQLYTDGLHLTPLKLRDAFYGLRPEAVAQPRLLFTDLDGDFRNPYLWAIPQDGFRLLNASVPLCLCHGDLNAHNMLVDTEGHFWLIDFASVDVNHALYDFVGLESDIKFSLLNTTDLRALLPFEQALSMPQYAGSKLQHLSFSDPRLDKAHRVITALRQLAAELVQPRADMRDYYQGLLFYALNVIRLRHVETGRKEHALLSAALLSERLDSWPVVRVRPFSGSRVQLPTPAEQPSRSRETLELARRFFEAAGFDLRVAAPDLFWVKKEGRPTPFPGEAPVFCTEAGQFVVPSQIDWLAREMTVAGQLPRYAFLIFHEPLTENAVRRIWAFRQQVAPIIIPIQALELETANHKIDSPEQPIDKLLSAIDEWTDIANPYETRNSLTHPQWFFGKSRRGEVRKLLDGILGGTSIIGIYGMRRVGKTAILNELARICADAGHLVAFAKCAEFTSQSISGGVLNNAVRQWFDAAEARYGPGVTSEAVEPQLDVLQSDLPLRSTLARLTRTFPERGQPRTKFVLFLDEMEHIFPRPGDGEDVYRQYCALAQALKEVVETPWQDGALTVVLAMQYPWVQTINHFPHTDKWQNPFYARVTLERVDFLNRADWEDMMQTIGALAGLEYTPAGLKALYGETGGHPDLARRLGSCLIELRDQGKIGSLIRRADVAVAVDLFLSNESRYGAFTLRETFWEDPQSSNLEMQKGLVAMLASESGLSREVIVSRLGSLADEKKAQPMQLATQEQQQGNLQQIAELLDRMEQISLITRDAVTETYDITIPLYREWVRRTCLGIEDRRV